MAEGVDTFRKIRQTAKAEEGRNWSFLPPDLRFTRFKSFGKGLLVAVRDRTGQGVLFGGAFEPAEYQLAGGEPAAGYFAAGELAFLEEVVDRMGRNPQHPGCGLGIEDFGIPGREEGEGRGRGKREHVSWAA